MNYNDDESLKVGAIVFLIIGGILAFISLNIGSILLILISIFLLGVGMESLRAHKKMNQGRTNNKNSNDLFERYNNPTYKNNTRYNNHCWNCYKKIDSYYDKKCSHCGWYICPYCGACSNKPNCEEMGKK